MRFDVHAVVRSITTGWVMPIIGISLASTEETHKNALVIVELAIQADSSSVPRNGIGFLRAKIS